MFLTSHQEEICEDFLFIAINFSPFWRILTKIGENYDMKPETQTGAWPAR